MGQLKVLEIGPRELPKAHLLSMYADGKAELVYMDADLSVDPHVVADASLPLPFADGAFDGIFASHIYEHIGYWKELSVLQEWARCLKEGGWLHLIVPSWEWVARQVLSENPSKGLKPYAFAGQKDQWDIHLNMYTMRQLRKLYELAGLSVVRARTAPAEMEMNGETYRVEEHYIGGVKGFPAPLTGR